MFRLTYKTAITRGKTHKENFICVTPYLVAVNNDTLLTFEFVSRWDVILQVCLVALPEERNRALMPLFLTGLYVTCKKLLSV
jgi:hypothetical protein